MKYDVIIRNGHVIDPANGMDQIADVAIQDGKIAVVQACISENGTKEYDASGLYVTPGLIDMHCHCYPTFPMYEDSLPTIHPDAHMFRTGVTTAVDAGTTGWKDFPRFKETVIDCSRTRVLAFINIADEGMVHLDGEQEPVNFHPEITAAVAKEYSDVIVGIKTAHYWVGIPFDEKHGPWDSVDAMVKAGELCGKPCMADFQPNLPLRTYPDLILKHLRPGDIHTHVFAQQFPILDEQGKVNDFMFQARERGIIFDLGHGACSFWFRNAVPSLKQGFYPDTITTDLYIDNVFGPVFGMDNVMSKYLCMGMSFEEIIFRTTQRPAQIIHHTELGTLSTGSCADIALFRIREGNFSYADGGRARIDGDRKIECAGTFRAGELVYNPDAMGMPKWEEAPEAYWTAPGIIR